MKLAKIITLGTVLTLGMPYGAIAGGPDFGGAGMEEIVVEAKHLPAFAEQGMEEIVVTAGRLPAEQEMEEIVVEAKRLRPSIEARRFQQLALAGDFGQMAVQTPSL